MANTIQPAGRISRVQQDITNLLLGAASLTLVNIYKFKDMVVLDVAEQALQIWADRSGRGQPGLAIEIPLPALIAVDPNVPGPQRAIQITIRCMEDPVVNNTGLGCEDIADLVIDFLNDWIIQTDATIPGVSAGIAGLELYFPDNQPAARPFFGYPDRFSQDVIIHSRLPNNVINRVNPPDLSTDGNGNVSLLPDSAYPDSAIYYTLDDSLPVIPVFADPGKPSYAAPPAAAPYLATRLYTGPFLAPVNGIVRYLAAQAGLRPSFAQRAQILVQ